MRRRRLARRAIFGGILALVIAIVVVSMLAPGAGEHDARALPPPALNGIAQKNDNAAVAAAAAMRARSATTARAADAIQDQQDQARNAAR